MPFPNTMPLVQDGSPSPELSPLAIGEDFTPLPTLKSAGTTEVDFSGLLAGSPLRLHEDLTNGCGGQLWPAGMTLAKHMLRYHRDDLHKSRVWVDMLFFFFFFYPLDQYVMMSWHYRLRTARDATDMVLCEVTCGKCNLDTDMFLFLSV